MQAQESADPGKGIENLFSKSDHDAVMVLVEGINGATDSAVSTEEEHC